MTANPEDLSETDEAILQSLQRGRCSPRYLADRLDEEESRISKRLERLVERGYVASPGPDLYGIDVPVSDGDAGATSDGRSEVVVGDDVRRELERRRRGRESLDAVLRRVLGVEGGHEELAGARDIPARSASAARERLDSQDGAGDADGSDDS